MYYDSPKTFLHSKAVVIDSRTSILGSTNWSRAALRDNHEISVLIDSEELARAVEDSLSGVILQGTPPVPTPKEGVLVPAEFLLAPGQGRRLVRDRAGKALDLYLLFLRESQAAGSRVVGMDCERYARLLGDEVPAGADSCEKLRRPMKRLEKRYGLLDYDARAKEVVLREPSSPERFALPFGYWEYGLARRLFLRAKYAYLIALLEARKSAKNPFWFRSQKDLSGLYGLSGYTLSLGLLELEKEDVLEVIRGEREGEFGERKANIYQVIPLVSPEEFQRRIGLLEARYGAGLVTRAWALSARLDEPKDLTKIEIYAQLIQEYGHEAVRKANERVARYKKGSALRHVATTVKLLRRR